MQGGLGRREDVYNEAYTDDELIISWLGFLNDPCTSMMSADAEIIEMKICNPPAVIQKTINPNVTIAPIFS